MTAHDLLTKLEQGNLVDKAIIGALRRKVSQPGKELSAGKVGKFLVSKGYLDQAQVDSLLEDEPAMRTLSEDDLIADVAEVAEVAELAELVEMTPAGEASTTEEQPPAKKKTKRRKKKKQTAAAIDAGGEEIVDLSAAAPAAPALEDLDDFSGHDPFGQQGEGLNQEEENEEKKEKIKTFKGKFVNENQWDSKWIFIGPTVVIVLGITSAFLWFLLSRGDAQKRYDRFLDSYRGQRYSEAIETGDTFVRSFPGNDNVDMVRALQGMAKIRIPVESNDWDTAIEKLETVLPEIQVLESFERPEVFEDVPNLILLVAAGFAANAEAIGDSDVETARTLLAQARRSRAFADRSEYIPSSTRKTRLVATRLLQIDESIARVQNLIDTEETLVASVKQIDESLAKSDTVTAFAIHKSLIRRYPRVSSDARLTSAVRRISDRERELVALIEREIDATPPDENPYLTGTHVITTRIGDTTASLDGEVMPVLLNGTVFALNVGTGDVLWRRYVGVATLHQPQWVDRQLMEDLIIVDGERHSLSRVDSKTGEERWSILIGEEFADPIIANERAYLATRSGNLIEVDLGNARSTRTSRIPQELITGPATDVRDTYLYQPGLHSNLYRISTSSLTCQEVYYMGHAPGSIIVPPVFASGYLFVAENRVSGASGSDTCSIHIMEQQADGLVPMQTPINLQGKVVEPMVVYQRKVLVITDLGDIALLDIDVTSETRPVTAVAEFQLESDPNQQDFFVAENGMLFVGARGLTGFSIQAQRGRFDRTVARNSGEIFVGPMKLYDDYLVHTHIRNGSSLVSVTALEIDRENEPWVVEPLWRTDLAAPLAGTPLLNSSDGVTAVNAQGDQFALTGEQLNSYSNRLPTRRGSTTLQDLVFTNLVRFADGSGMAFGPGQLSRQADGSDERMLQTMAIDPNQTGQSSRTSARDMLYRELATEPVKFGNGILVPSTSGAVFYVHPQTARDLTTPFQPAIEPGQALNWCRPVALDDQRFAIADARGVIYQVNLQSGDQVGLVKGTETRHDAPFVSPLTASAGNVVVVCQEAGRQKILAFDTQQGVLGKEVELSGRITAGPFSVADMIFVALDSSELVCFDPALDEQWRFDLGNSIPVGPPVLDGEDLVLGLNRGYLVRIDSGSGEERGRVDVGEPIMHNIAHIGDRWIAGTLDGTVLVFSEDF